MLKINDVADKLNIIEIIKYDNYYENMVYSNGVKFKINNLEYNDISAKYGGGGFDNNFLVLHTIKGDKNTKVKLINDYSNSCFCIESDRYDTKYTHTYINYKEKNTSTNYWTSYSINIKKLADFINTLQSTMVLSANEELTDDDKVVTIRELTQEEIEKLNKNNQE